MNLREAHAWLSPTKRDSPEVLLPLLQDFQATVTVQMASETLKDGVKRLNWIPGRTKLPYNVHKSTTGASLDHNFATLQEAVEDYCRL